MPHITCKLNAEQRLVEIASENLLSSHVNDCPPRGSVAEAMSKDDAKNLADEIERLHLFFDPTFEIGGFTADDFARMEEANARAQRG